jgi:hypothetical protein
MPDYLLRGVQRQDTCSEHAAVGFWSASAKPRGKFHVYQNSRADRILTTSQSEGTTIR